MKTIVRMAVLGVACTIVSAGCLSMGKKQVPMRRFVLEAEIATDGREQASAKTLERSELPVLAIGRFRGTLEASERAIRWVDVAHARTGRLADGEFAQPAVDSLKSSLWSGLYGLPGYRLIADAGIVSAGRQNTDLLEGWIEHCRLVRDSEGHWQAVMRVQFLLYRKGVLEREFCVWSVQSAMSDGVPTAETAVGLFRATLQDLLRQVQDQLTVTNRHEAVRR